MRFLFIILTFCFIWSGSASQTFTPFIDSNSVWRDVKLISCGHAPSYMNKYWSDGQEFIKGDTTIGQLYSKVIFSGNIYHFLYDHGLLENDSVFHCEKYIGGIREDSFRRVYFLDTLGNEKLLFDFSLNLGDSININAGTPFTFYVYVDSIDSVYVYNSYRKRFKLYPHPSSGYFYPLIEGIGMHYGLLGNAYGSVCIYDGLKSYYYNNTASYTIDSSATLISCPPLITQEPFSESVSVFPNPFTSHLSLAIQKENLHEVNIRIMNPLGQVVYTRQKIILSSGYFEELDLSFLNKGLYFLELIINGEKTSMKILKQ